jgi:hypothetical protein
MGAALSPPMTTPQACSASCHFRAKSLGAVARSGETTSKSERAGAALLGVAAGAALLVGGAAAAEHTQMEGWRG